MGRHRSLEDGIHGGMMSWPFRLTDQTMTYWQRPNPPGYRIGTITLERFPIRLIETISSWPGADPANTQSRDVRRRMAGSSPTMTELERTTLIGYRPKGSL